MPVEHDVSVLSCA